MGDDFGTLLIILNVSFRSTERQPLPRRFCRIKAASEKVNVTPGGSYLCSSVLSRLACCLLRFYTL